MKVVYSKYIPFKGFRAINLFGAFVIREEYRAFFKENPSIKAKLFNHESIHTQQIKEMLYLFFYLWYGIEWLIRWFGCGFKSKKAYRNIMFEREAYQNEINFEYLKIRKSFSWFIIPMKKLSYNLFTNNKN